MSIKTIIEQYQDNKLGLAYNLIKPISSLSNIYIVETFIVIYDNGIKYIPLEYKEYTEVLDVIKKIGILEKRGYKKLKFWFSKSLDIKTEYVKKLSKD